MALQIDFSENQLSGEIPVRAQQDKRTQPTLPLPKPAYWHHTK